MINDTLDAIIAAEKQADELTAKAAEDARQAVASADEESARIRSETVKAVKSERKKVIESAEDDGKTQCDRIMASGKTVAEKLVKETDVDAAVNFIKEKVLSDYGNR
jgi:vacuolar-type H+-ATPase subunit H